MSRNKYKAFYKNKQFQELRHQYMLLGTSVMEWTGLEELDIPVYEPENTLYKQGVACMFKIPGTDQYGILPVAYGSISIDIYGRPLTWRAYAVGNTPMADMINNTVLSSTEVPGTEPSVLIWNDYTRTPTQPYIDTMLCKMLNVDMALESNINVQKTPFLINCNIQNQLTAKNFYANIQDVDAIFKSTDVEDLSVDVINLGVSFLGAELSDQYKTFENRILEYLGIENLPVEKQERMLTGEVSSNDDKTNLMLEARLYMREKACKEMKDIFGIDVEVKKRELPLTTPGLQGTFGSEGTDTESGGKDNGSGNQTQ